MWPNLQETGDLVKFTEEILNGQFHFLYIGKCDQILVQWIIPSIVETVAPLRKTL